MNFRQQSKPRQANQGTKGQPRRQTQQQRFIETSQQQKVQQNDKKIQKISLRV
jgi:hypothetical protein